MILADTIGSGLIFGLIACFGILVIFLLFDD